MSFGALKLNVHIKNVCDVPDSPIHPIQKITSSNIPEGEGRESQRVCWPLSVFGRMTLTICGPDLKQARRVLGKTGPKALDHLVPKIIVAITPQAFQVNFVAGDLTEIQ